MEEKKYSAIEEWRTAEGTSYAVFEGVKAANGWKTGKKVTEEDYKKAVKDFEKAPIDGREVKNNV